MTGQNLLLQRNAEIVYFADIFTSCGAHHPLGIQDFMHGNMIDKGNWNAQPNFMGNSKKNMTVTALC
jgi:hypothetical protein